MISSSSPIHLLDSEVRSTIRSNFIIVDFPTAIQECVENSLDAESNQIQINIHFENWSFTVTDNGIWRHKCKLKMGISNQMLTSMNDCFLFSLGHGLSPSQLQQCGIRHSSSKQ